MTFRIVSIFQKKNDMETTGKYLYAGDGLDMEYVCEIKDENLFSEDLLHNAIYINACIEEQLEKHENPLI